MHRRGLHGGEGVSPTHKMTVTHFKGHFEVYGRGPFQHCAPAAVFLSLFLQTQRPGRPLQQVRRVRTVGNMGSRFSSNAVVHVLESRWLPEAATCVAPCKHKQRLERPHMYSAGTTIGLTELPVAELAKSA